MKETSKANRSIVEVWCRNYYLGREPELPLKWPYFRLWS